MGTVPKNLRVCRDFRFCEVSAAVFARQRHLLQAFYNSIALFLQRRCIISGMINIDMTIAVVGGLAIFVYGMNLMSDGLQQVAGEKLKSILSLMTKNRVLAIMTGALVTAIIQSSSATTVMTVGFVNAGLLSLVQAIGHIRRQYRNYRNRSAGVAQTRQSGDAFNHNRRRGSAHRQTDIGQRDAQDPARIRLSFLRNGPDELRIERTVRK